MAATGRASVMKYSIKELYLTLQGEGFLSGRPAVFCRFSGCNLWSGREADRVSAVCNFCDTDFVGTDGAGGGVFHNADDLAAASAKLWKSDTTPFVVCTGGEPLLQMDEDLIDAFHNAGFEIAVETNGTLPMPRGVDWVCVSPKANTKIVVQCGEELKLVFPQKDACPQMFEGWDFKHFYLQPMDGPELDANRRQTVEYCRNNPIWKLSTQVHKEMGIR